MLFETGLALHAAHRPAPRVGPRALAGRMSGVKARLVSRVASRHALRPKATSRRVEGGWNADCIGIRIAV
jgi:hypothetical protein